MTRPIGYYAHHQGAGHLHRARLIAGALRRPCTLIGTFDDAGHHPAVPLPDDRTGKDFDGADSMSSRPEALHYAPLNHVGIRTRMAAIATWVVANDPALMIVDVSVEVALFVRLLSVPLVLVRLAGVRNDQPHLEAFRAAEAMIAPFPTSFESAATPAWIREKTIYAGFLTPPVIGVQATLVKGEIAVVFGRGGARISFDSLVDAAKATPSWTWRVYGDTLAETRVLPPNLHLHGWVDGIGPALDRAEIVVGGAGDGLLSTVVSRKKRFVCIPEPRAFDEQIEKAQVLIRLNLAVVVPQWPAASAWPKILLRAMALDPRRLHAFYDRHALTATAAAIETICASVRTRDPLEPQLS